MTGKLSKNFHGAGIGPLSKILAVKGSGLCQNKIEVIVGLFYTLKNTCFVIFERSYRKIIFWSQNKQIECEFLKSLTHIVY